MPVIKKRPKLSPEETVFCGDIIESLQAGERPKLTVAYRKAFPDKTDGMDKRRVLIESKALLKKPHIQTFLKFADKDPDELAEMLLPELMLFSDNTKDRLDAAKAQFKIKESRENKEAIDLWIQRQIEVGAKPQIPVGWVRNEIKDLPDDAVVEFGFEDFLNGRVLLNYPLAARLRLAEAAGFPWNELEPEATISPKQIELVGRDERFVYVPGATGSGKSVTGALIALIELSKPNRKVAIVGGLYKHVMVEAAFIVKGFKKLYGNRAARIVEEVKKNKTEFLIETIWGSTCRGIPLNFDEGANILGEGFDVIICAEGDQIDYDTFRRKVLRASARRIPRPRHGYQERTGRIFGMSTGAYGEGAVCQEYEKYVREAKGDTEALQVGKVPWVESVYLTKLHFLDNPSNDEATYEAARKQLADDPEAFEEQFQGGITRRGGLVFDRFDPHKHVIAADALSANVLQGMRFCCSIDFGSNFAVALCAADSQGNYFVVDEMTTFKNTIWENADQIKEMVVRTLGPVFNPTGFTIEDRFEQLKHQIYWTGDISTQFKQEIEQLLGIGIDYPDLDVLLSINQMNALFSKSKILVSEVCQDCLKDISRYIWKTGTTSDKKEVRKKYDHILDAARYAIVGHLIHFGGPTSSTEPVSYQRAFDDHVRQTLDWKNDTLDRFVDDWGYLE